jgi:hypothetical protein
VGGGMAELANTSVVHLADAGSNLGINRKYFLILFLSHSNSNLSGIYSCELFINVHVY